MKLSERLKIAWYRLKYRTHDGCSAAFIVTDKRKEDSFKQLCDRVAAETVPQSHSIDEVLEYISEKYGAQECEMSDGARNAFKANVILRHFSDVLSVSEIKLNDDKKMPSRRMMHKHIEASNARFKEAIELPEEGLGLSISHMEFEYVTKSERRVTFSVTAERKSGELSVDTRIDGNVDETESGELERVAEDITLFRGVSAEDIENRTERFLSYAYIVGKNASA